MDFIIRLPKFNGFDVIFVVVDRLCNDGHFIPLKHPYSTRSMVEIFVKKMVRLYRTPTSIVSDKDPLFMSLFWKELFRLQGMKLNMSTTYHPELDGQIEILNIILETYEVFLLRTAKDLDAIYAMDRALIQHQLSRSCEIHSF